LNVETEKFTHYSSDSSVLQEIFTKIDLKKINKIKMNYFSFLMFIKKHVNYKIIKIIKQCHELIELQLGIASIMERTHN